MCLSSKGDSEAGAFCPDFFSSSDLEMVQKYPLGLNHPLLYLNSNMIDSTGCYGATRHNTSTAIEYLREANLAWLKKEKVTLLNKNHTSASGGFGEVRCYSLLGQTFGKENVVPVPVQKNVQTPDFEIKNDNETISVEVNTPQINETEGEQLSDFNTRIASISTSGISIAEDEYCPYGSKKDMTITETVIGRLTSVKEHSGQLAGNHPNILWIDLQDEYMNQIDDRARNLRPFFFGRQIGGNSEGAYANELWYSLYAKKGMPIFEGSTLNPGEGIPLVLNVMQFDGKFVDKSKASISAVIFSLPQAVIICENPLCTYPLSLDFLKKLMWMPRFRLESSRTNFPNCHLNMKLQEDVSMLLALANHKFYSW